MRKSYILRNFSLANFTSELEELSPRDKEPLTEKDVIYVYYGKNDIYIGQTSEFIKRHKQHLSEEIQYEKLYTNVVTIYGQLIDKNSLNDIEKTLITLFTTDNNDKKFTKKGRKINNGTSGNKSNQYPTKSKVLSDVIIPFWSIDLNSYGIVNNPDISSLKESLLYKYSPFKELNDEQNSIVESIINTQNNSIVHGFAGTGKTVLFTNIIARYIKEFKDKKIGAVAKSNWVSSAKKIFDSYTLHEENKNLIVGSSYEIIQHKEKFDIILVDESHSLEWDYPKKSNVQKHIYTADNNNRLSLLSNKTKQLVLMYDEFQTSRPSHIPKEIFNKFINEHNFTEFRLNTQFRINLDNRKIDYTSNDYFNGLLHFLELNTDKNCSFNSNVFLDKSDKYGEPYFGIVDSIEELFDYINYETNRNSSTVNRVVSGYYKEWVSKNNKEKYDWTIDKDGSNRKWNSSYENWVMKSNSIDEIGSIFSIQGVDLNYVGVIIGDDLTVSNGKLIGNEKAHYDKLAIPTNQEYEQDSFEASNRFTNYIKNAYYILMTRGIDGIRVYFTNEEVKKYFLDKITNIKNGS